MKAYTEATYRKEIKKEVLAVFSKYQQASKDGNFSGDHRINLIYTDFNTMERTKNTVLNGYLKYNSHLKQAGRGNDSQLIASDEIFNDINKICLKYNINLGLTGLVDLCSDKLFKNWRDGSYIKEEFDKGFNIYKVLSMVEELQVELVVNEAPIKRKVNKI